SDEIKESTKETKKLKYDDIEIIPISRKKYTQLKQRLAFLTNDEKEQIYIFELFDFFNILDKPEFYIETLKFDETGKARLWMKNLELCRNADKKDDVTTLDKLKEIVTLKVLCTLGIDINTFEGVYSSKEISELENFIHKGEITLHGKKLKMSKIKKRLFDISSKKYKSKGAFAKAIIGKFLGLKHEFASRKRTKDIDESFYQISTESKDLINKYYGISSS
ncbi:MAG: phage regulator Rha-like protein, partial [Mariniflexile sp.]